MSASDDTLERSLVSSADAGGEPQPGLAVVFTGGRPTLKAIPLARTPTVLGRGELVDDARMSRRHAEAWFAGGRFHLRDLGSQNGSLVDGAPASGALAADARVIRLGDTLMIIRPDVRRLLRATVSIDGGVVIGPTLRAAYDEVASVAAAGETVFLTGESGAGKELLARHFHAVARGERAPFVAINAATVPPALAERLLFGARKGAYSGADVDVVGYVQAADGGTLFLDEVAELPADVQAKLLRVLETREVTPLGATQARAVSVALCTASHADLRAAVAAGRFREDLYYRLGRPSVAVPPLRERGEDVPWLVTSSVARAAPELAAHVSLIEAALARPWPGNVRELKAEIADATRRAQRAGDKLVRDHHLDPAAGTPIVATSTPSPATLDVARVEDALRAAQGNVTAAARALGLHRNQLRRWISEHDVDPSRFRDET